MVKERIDSEGYEPISGGGNTPLRDAFNNASRRDALLFTANFANSSVANTKDHQQRDLPRLNERDSAFISLLKSIDKQIGDTPYALSDIVSFFRIEDIIKHPLLAQDIPQSLQENQDIEVELDNGTTLIRIGRMPEPTYNLVAKDFSSGMQNSERKNLSLFAHDMAQKTSLVFQRDVEHISQLSKQLG